MRTFTGSTWRLAAVAFNLSVVMLCMLCMACGSDDGGGGSPMTPSGGPGPSGATITVGSNGTVSPSSVSISVGQSVTFINNDSRSHELASDPHPLHTNCPSINALGVVGTGQTKLTNSFGAAGTCGFHDHNDPDNNGLKGTISIR
jgi:plastocyanin